MLNFSKNKNKIFISFLYEANLKYRQVGLYKYFRIYYRPTKLDLYTNRLSIENDYYYLFSIPFNFQQITENKKYRAIYDLNKNGEKIIRIYQKLPDDLKIQDTNFFILQKDKNNNRIKIYSDLKYELINIINKTEDKENQNTNEFKNIVIFN